MERKSACIFRTEWGRGRKAISLARLCLVFSVYYACFLILSFGFSVMAFCFSIPAVLFQHHLSPFDFTLRYFGHLPFVFLRRSVLFLLLCPRFVAFSLIFPLALSFFKEICPFSSRFVCLRGRNMTSSSFSSPAKVEIWAIGEEFLLVKLIFSAKTEI